MNIPSVVFDVEYAFCMCFVRVGFTRLSKALSNYLKHVIVEKIINIARSQRSYLWNRRNTLQNHKNNTRARFAILSKRQIFRKFLKEQESDKKIIQYSLYIITFDTYTNNYCSVCKFVNISSKY